MVGATNEPHWAWLPEGEPLYPLECWLRSLPAGAAVSLLVVPGRAEVARAVAVRCPVLQDVIPVEEGAPLPITLEGHERLCAILPTALDMIPMRYRPALMPDVARYYPLLRTLWRWGFRQVRFAGPCGGHVFDIPHLPDAMHHRHQGKRCFVVGNGPSLNDIDMTRLKDEITLGSNRCFLGYKQWGFPFTYWGVYDKFQIEEYHAVYEDNVPADTVKFFPVEYLPVLQVANGCPVHSLWPRNTARAFSAEPDATYVGFTVTYMLLQIAACMGCDPIILIGADHRYALTRRGYSRAFRNARRGIARRLRGGRLYETALAAQRAWKKTSGHGAGAPAVWTTEDAPDPTHFTAGYTAGGKNRFLPPEPEEAEKDFDCARAWAEANGRQIVNATPGTALESFPLIEFDALF